MEAGESTASHGVSAEDRWMGDGGPAAADPMVMVEGVALVPRPTR